MKITKDTEIELLNLIQPQGIFSKNLKRKFSPNIITSKSDNPFRRDVGDVADFFSFNLEFLGRRFSPKQTEVLSQVWSKDVEVWNTDYHLIILEIGMKGGKNYILESDAAYTLYFLNCLKNKWEYFSKVTKRQLPYTEDINFDIGNASAVDQNQAKRAFFAKVRNIIKLTKDPKTGENWFARYARLDTRETFGNLNQEAIEFPSEHDGQGRVRLYSFNSTSKAPEGLHFFRFYFDEPSRAKTKALYTEAKAVFDLGENNTRASFPNRTGKAFAWSYPNDTDFDLIVDLYERSIKDKSVYGTVCPTFDFNLSLTKEMLEDAYNNDPIAAARIYECIKPPSSQNLYFPRTFKLQEAVKEEIKNKVSYVTYSSERKTDNGDKYKFTSIELQNIQGDKRHRCFAGDYSVNGDRFVMVGGYNDPIDPTKMSMFLDDDWTVIDTNVKPVVDIIIVIEAKSREHPVDYLAVGKILTALKQNFPNMQSFNTDRMQNEKLRQELIEKGVSSKSYSFSRKQQFNLYIKKRWTVWNNNLAICKDDNPAHIVKVGTKDYSPSELWVLEGEKLIRDGEKIDHPEQYSKDVQDAVAIVINDLLELEVKEVENKAGSIDELTEEKFRELVEKLINIKYEYEDQELPEDQLSVILSERMNLKLRDIEVLEKFIRENYDF